MNKRERMQAKKHGAVAFTYSGYPVFPSLDQAINYAGGAYAERGDYGVWNVVYPSGAVGGLGGGIGRVERHELYRLVDNRSKRIRKELISALINNKLYRVI